MLRTELFGHYTRAGLRHPDRALTTTKEFIRSIRSHPEKSGYNLVVNLCERHSSLVALKVPLTVMPPVLSGQIAVPDIVLPLSVASTLLGATTADPGMLPRLKVMCEPSIWPSTTVTPVTSLVMVELLCVQRRTVIPVCVPVNASPLRVMTTSMASTSQTSEPMVMSRKFIRHVPLKSTGAVAWLQLTSAANVMRRSRAFTGILGVE